MKALTIFPAPCFSTNNIVLTVMYTTLIDLTRTSAYLPYIPHTVLCTSTVLFISHASVLTLGWTGLKFVPLSNGNVLSLGALPILGNILVTSFSCCAGSRVSTAGSFSFVLLKTKVKVKLLFTQKYCEQVRIASSC